jgi:hypothetical protein
MKSVPVAHLKQCRFSELIDKLLDSSGFAKKCRFSCNNKEYV